MGERGDRGEREGGREEEGERERRREGEIEKARRERGRTEGEETMSTPLDQQCTLYCMWAPQLSSVKHVETVNGPRYT